MEYFNQLTIHSISLQMWLKGTIIQLNYFFIVFRGYYLKVWNVLTVNSIWPCPAERAIIRQRVKLGLQWDTVCLSLIKGSQSFGAAIPFLLSYVTPCISEVEKQEGRKPIWSRIWSLFASYLFLFYIMRQGPMNPRLTFYIVEDSLEFLVLCLFLSNAGISGICLYHALLLSLPGHMEITGRCPWCQNQ